MTNVEKQIMEALTAIESGRDMGHPLKLMMTMLERKYVEVYYEPGHGRVSYRRFRLTDEGRRFINA